MKQSGISRLFILTCVAVLLASYGVGLGVKKVRFAAAEKNVAAVETDKQQVKSETGDENTVAAKGSGPTESSEEAAGGTSEEVTSGPDEEVAARPERPGGRRTRGEGMMGGGMRERFQNMTEEERAEMRERFAARRGGGEGRGGGPFGQMSEEDRANFRAEMEELRARESEMSEDEQREAREAIFEKYGLPTGGGGGRGRRGGRE